VGRQGRRRAQEYDWFQIQVWGQLAKFAATLKAGTPVIVEGKIKPETYTVDGVEHKTFSIKADYSARSTTRHRTKPARARRPSPPSRQESQVAPAQPGGGSSEPPFIWYAE